MRKFKSTIMQRALSMFSAFIVLTMTFGCNSGNLKSTNDPEIKKIVIKAFPSFHNRSMFIIDIDNGDILFDKLGNMLFFDEEMNHSIAPFSHSFTNLELTYLRDSIIDNLKEADFKDLEAPVMDGISTDLLFIFKSDEVKKVHLSNGATVLQDKLIKFMFEIVIENCSDTSNISYAKRILDYYD